MISKELLSEVLGLKRIDEIYIEDSVLYFCELNNGINIYELAHKCKEYAYSQGYIISSGLTPVLGINKDGWAEVFSSSTPLDGKLHTFKQLSEPEAIFKTAQWVLDNVKTNSLP